MDPAVRLLRLLSLLQARSSWPAAELAERLAVDRRTIRRDVARLRVLGYPVDSSPGLAGYSLGAGGQLPPLLLDDDEAVAITVGLRLAAAAAIEGIESSAVAAMAKLDQVMPPQVRARVRSLDASTVHLDRALVDRVDPETLTVLARACRGCERVHFSYRAFGGAQTERRTEPSQIVHTARRWYLVALDLERKDWRTFRVDRIHDVAQTGHHFERRDPPDAAARVREARAFAPPAIEATIVVELAVDDAYRRFAADGGTVEARADGRSTVRITGSTVDQLARYVAGLPLDLELIDPPEVRTRLHQLAAALAARHAPTS